MADSNLGSDFSTVKQRQQATWASGDYAVIGSTMQIVGETLCEAMDLRSGWRVLDVAAGNGNATLAAARRWCDVTSTDYVPALLERARIRAVAEGYTVRFQEADAENLPFSDREFDAVISTFGVMFTPQPERGAAEMLRVCKPGGRIGLTNWTPGGFVGQVFKCVGKHVPPHPAAKSPALWGTDTRLRELFGSAVTIETSVRHYVFRYRSPAHWLEVFRTYFGPTRKAFAALDPAGQTALADDLLALLNQLNRANDGTLVLPSEYLEIVITPSAP